MSFLYLAIIISLTPIFVFKTQTFLQLKNSDEEASMIYDTLENIKSQSPFSVLSFGSNHEFYSKSFQLFLSSKEDNSTEIDQIIEKNPEKLTKRYYFMLLENYLEKSCKTSIVDHSLKLILLVKVRMQLGFPLNSIIQDI